MRKLIIILTMILLMLMLNLHANEKKKNDVVKLDYQGRQGYWFSFWYANQLLMIENAYESSIKINNEMNNMVADYFKSYNRQKIIITALCITTAGGFIITVGLAVGVIVYAVLNYSSRWQR